MRVVAICLLMLVISSMVLTDDTVTKLEDSMQKRLHEIKNNPSLDSHYREYLQKFQDIQRAYQATKREGHEAEANDKFKIDAMHLLIDMYETESLHHTN